MGGTQSYAQEKRTVRLPAAASYRSQLHPPDNAGVPYRFRVARGCPDQCLKRRGYILIYFTQEKSFIFMKISKIFGKNQQFNT